MTTTSVRGPTARRPRTRSRLPTTYRAQRGLLRTPGRRVTALVGATVLAVLPGVLTERALFGLPLSETVLLGIGLPQVNLALIAAVGALALNLLVGVTGLISLGHAAFFAVGAVVAGLTGTLWGLPFPLVLVLAAAVGAAVGLLVGLPSLRLQGLYLMLATLALHFVGVYLFLRFQLAAFGPAGIVYDLPSIGPWVLDSEVKWYAFLLVFAILVVLGFRSLLRTRQGRSFVAVRDHEIAAASLGVNVAATRLRSFALSSAVVCLLGAVYAYYLGNVVDGSFSLNFVIGYFAMVIIGGIGSMTGAVLGAALWILLPQALQTVAQEVGTGSPALGGWLLTYRGQVISALLGLLIIVVLRFWPSGLYGLWRSTSEAVRRWPYSR
jgi:branched-chain amino acid transport system permease protein